MVWSEEDVLFLRKNYGTEMPISEICSKLGKSRRAILHKAARSGLSRMRVPHNKPKNLNYRKFVDKKYYLEHREKIYDQKRRRVTLYKKEFTNLLGGKCSICGYDKCIAALEFHHKAGNKENLISVMFNAASKEKILKEVNKCILVCANCHRDIHFKDP
jgi:hypothetical protein